MAAQDVTRDGSAQPGAPTSIRHSRSSAGGLPTLVDEAFRRLNRPAALAESRLIAALPRTLAASSRLRGVPPAQVTPLLRAQALREVLLQVLERLKPPGYDPGRPDPSALQYALLHQAYVLGIPNKEIGAAFHVSKSSFHRHRREAIRALAGELIRLECALAAEPEHADRAEG